MRHLLGCNERQAEGSTFKALILTCLVTRTFFYESPMLRAARNPTRAPGRITKKRDRGFAESHSQMENTRVETHMQSRALKKSGQPGHRHGIEKDLKSFVLNQGDEIGLSGDFPLRPGPGRKKLGLRGFLPNLPQGFRPEIERPLI